MCHWGSWTGSGFTVNPHFPIIGTIITLLGPAAHVSHAWPAAATSPREYWRYWQWERMVWSPVPSTDVLISESLPDLDESTNVSHLLRLFPVSQRAFPENSVSHPAESTHQKPKRRAIFKQVIWLNSTTNHVSAVFVKLRGFVHMYNLVNFQHFWGPSLISNCR